MSALLVHTPLPKKVCTARHLYASLPMHRQPSACNQRHLCPPRWCFLLAHIKKNPGQDSVIFSTSISITPPYIMGLPYLNWHLWCRCYFINHQDRYPYLLLLNKKSLFKNQFLSPKQIWYQYNCPFTYLIPIFFSSLYLYLPQLTPLLFCTFLPGPSYFQHHICK